MKILGICHDVIICSACLVIDGEIVAAAAEERLDRQKRSRVFPTLAVQDCLARAGLRMADIDEIAVAWNPGYEAETVTSGWLNARRWRTEHFHQVPSRLLRMTGAKADALVTQGSLGQGVPPVTYVDHYLSHLGNAAYQSPFEECAVLILDGRGEKNTGLMGTVKGTEVNILHEYPFPHSLGLFYGAVTQFLGFRPDSDEWKVMALASYAEADNAYLAPMRELIRLQEAGGFGLALEHFQHFNFWDKRLYADSFEAMFGPPRSGDEPLEKRHQEIAAAMQLVFEDTVTHCLRGLHERTGLSRVVVNGGCFMNSVYNGKMDAVGPFEESFIGSCPDDSGTAVGAALYLYAERTKQRPQPVHHNYWGRSFDDGRCLAVAERYRLPAEVVKDPSDRAAQDLVDGKLIGWFQGAAEFGQRALGHRSILVDPRREDGKDIVNASVKYRESFRPFAPAILEERVHEYFECEPRARVPYMERVFTFRQDKRAAVPAVVHVDGSGRLQTVGKEHAPRYRRLIEKFDERTGVPIVLNTSFNLNGEPMVDSPTDAIRTFYSSGLDVLYLGNVRITKR